MTKRWIMGLLLTGCLLLSRGVTAEAGRTAEGQPEQKITVVAVNYRFQPARINVKKGTKVTIRLENRGTEPHEFEMEALDFEIGPIQPGQVGEKSFVAEKTGEFAYECHVDGHLQKGMQGILSVSE